MSSSTRLFSGGTEYYNNGAPAVIVLMRRICPPSKIHADAALFFDLTRWREQLARSIARNNLRHAKRDDRNRGEPDPPLPDVSADC